MKEMDMRRRGRPRVDTGSRPAPDIGSSCPGPKCRPVASLARAKRDSGFSLPYTATPDQRTNIHELPCPSHWTRPRGEKSECTRSSTHSSHYRSTERTVLRARGRNATFLAARSIHLSLVNETQRIRCATHSYQRYSWTSRTDEFTRAVLREAADRLETAFPYERTLDVRPYIKMASPPAWHPLAKPQPISRTLR